MTEVAGHTVHPDNNYDDERIVAEFWPAAWERNALYQLANSLPWFLGGPVFFLAYGLRPLFYGLDLLLTVVTLGAVKLRANQRYTLTNRRLRVDRGIGKETVRSVPLEEITTIRVANNLKFTRTGDLQIVSDDRVALTLVGVRDPVPTRQTILDAACARVRVQEVLEQQRQAQALAGSPT